MLTSVRLDADMQRELERLAKETGRTKSEIIRDSIMQLVANRAAENERGKAAHEAISDLIGSVRGGPRDLSAATGQRFRNLVEEKQRRRRT